MKKKLRTDFSSNHTGGTGIRLEKIFFTRNTILVAKELIGKTIRNSAMFETGGIAYVYFTYGNHYCFNVVTGIKGRGSGVLIRGVVPLEGIDIMLKNRNTTDIYNLTNGPGKFAQAFGIDRKLNSADLSGDEIFLIEPEEKTNHKILKSTRVGITKNTEKLYRFYIKDNPFVSGIGKAARKKRL